MGEGGAQKSSQYASGRPADLKIAIRDFPLTVAKKVTDLKGDENAAEATDGHLAETEGRRRGPPRRKPTSPITSLARGAPQMRGHGNTLVPRNFRNTDLHQQISKTCPEKAQIKKSSSNQKAFINSNQIMIYSPPNIIYSLHPHLLR
jgi:hypothetical protein